MRKPPRPCRKCGQRATRGSLCDWHARQHEDRRGSPTDRGYGARHRNMFRANVLAMHPICQLCGDSPSVHADHYPQTRATLVRLGLDADDPKYGRGLCASCHTAWTNQSR